MYPRLSRAVTALALCASLGCVADGGYPSYATGGGYPGYPTSGGLTSADRRDAVATCTRHAERAAKPEGAKDVYLDRLVSVRPQGGRIDVLAYYDVEWRHGRTTAYAECGVDRSPWRVRSFRWDDARPPGPPGSGDAERAREQCRDAVQRRGYQLRRFTSTVAGDRYVAVEMNVRRSNTSYDAECSYDRRSGSARVTSVTPESGGGGDFVQTAIGRCRQEARRRDLPVKRVLSAEPERHGARVELEVKRGSSHARATCRVRYDGRLDFAL
jgi:hypothetical protein